MYQSCSKPELRTRNLTNSTFLVRQFVGRVTEYSFVGLGNPDVMIATLSDDLPPFKKTSKISTTTILPKVEYLIYVSDVV